MKCALWGVVVHEGYNNIMEVCIMINHVSSNQVLKTIQDLCLEPLDNSKLEHRFPTIIEPGVNTKIQ